MAIRVQRPVTVPHADVVVSEAAGFLRAGWRQISQDARAFSALVDSVVLGIGLSALVVIVPQFLEDVLHTGADNTVFVFAPAAAGLVAGLQVAPLAGRLIGHGRLATLGIGLFCCALIAIGSISVISGWLDDRPGLISWLDGSLGLSPEISTTMLLSIPAGFAVGIVNVAVRTELIVRTPAPSHARVFSTQMTIANLGALIPTIAIGFLVDIVPVQLVALAIAIMLASGAILGRSLAPFRIGNREGSSVKLTAAEIKAIVAFMRDASKPEEGQAPGLGRIAVDDPESSADHSWAVAIFAWLFRLEAEDLDSERVLLPALVHDLPEALAGDATPFDVHRDDEGDIVPEHFQTAPIYDEPSQRERSPSRTRDGADEMTADRHLIWHAGSLAPGRNTNGVGENRRGTLRASGRQAWKRRCRPNSIESEPELIINSFRAGSDRDVITDDQLRSSTASLAAEQTGIHQNRKPIAMASGRGQSPEPTTLDADGRTLLRPSRVTCRAIDSLRDRVREAGYMGELRLTIGNAKIRSREQSADGYAIRRQTIPTAPR
ncbi:MAG: HD domain-containing protein [Thermomicrobiales bacterium]